MKKHNNTTLASSRFTPGLSLNVLIQSVSVMHPKPLKKATDPLTHPNGFFDQQ
jgi:hypothetical protein